MRFAVAGLACAVALVVVPRVTAWARRLGWLDVPGDRSTHRVPVPRTGGIGLAVAFLAGVVLWAAVDSAWDAAWRFLLPGAAWFLLGAVDDVARLRARTKLVGQVACAALSVAVGFRWEGRGVEPFPALAFGDATPFMTALWFFAVTTVVNFVDGIDLITCATCAVLLGAAAGGGAGPGGGAVCAAAAGGVLGLAFWNATPAHVFPGDGATHLLGFLAASVACALPAASPPGDALPWALASAPLLPGAVDVGTGIVRKLRRGQPLSAAHRDHLYQRLARAAGSHPGSALRYGVLALAAVVVVARVGPLAGWPGVLLVSAAVLGLHYVQAARATSGPAEGGPRTIPRP
jgi:UDP-N-acetylmuramyl pentapeptide phosphotransferase/UDP-N-acetylglucosamine-1-phosphate transferase